jgi:putative ABC transport system permease protein
VNSLMQDVRYGLRSLRKTPGFAAVAMLTLALGVGANTAIFSVLRGVVLRDLPYHDAERIAVLWTRNIRQDLPDGSSYLNFRDWRAQSTQFTQMAAYVRPEFTRGTLMGGPQAERIHTALVGPDFFQLLGTAPLLGRTFDAADHRDNPRAVVISHALWRQRFGGDRAVLGRSVQLGERTVEVVGVMPAEFQFPTAEAQLWQPLWFGPAEQAERTRGSDGLIVLGRLAPSASMASARAEMDTIAARLRAQHPATNAAFGVLTYPLIDRVIGSTTERSLWLLFGSVGLVLLIACANVANLVLARAAGRRGEYALRSAVGASAMRLVRQALSESLVLSLLAGAVAFIFAWGGTVALRALAPGALPRPDSIHVDAGVLLFLLAVSLGSGLLAGLLPALQLSTTRPAEALREGGARTAGGPSRRRLHHGLVVAEVALSVVLLSGAGLLMRSLLRVQGSSRGFDSSNVLLLQMDLPRTYNDRAKSAAFYAEAFRRIRALPGVVAVGAISDFFIHRQPDYRVTVEGQPRRLPSDPAPPLTGDNVMPGYFEAMRIPVLRGRSLQDGDLAPGAPLAVVINEEMARRFWPGQDAVGKRLKYGLDPAGEAPWKTVVGVVADMRRQRLDQPAIPYMFEPGVVRDMDIAVRTVGDQQGLREAIRAELQALDPSAPPHGVVTVEQRLGQTVALRRLQTLLLIALAAVALMLTMIGVYGVIHQSVAARAREIGIRMALGADARRVLAMVLAGGLRPSMTGIALGLLGSLALSRTMASFLYETSPLDPIIHVAVIALLLAVTTLACLAPATRAARSDPMNTLRRE